MTSTPIDTPTTVTTNAPTRTPTSAPKVIAIVANKGGVGKTTTAVNLGLALLALGQRVLLIDLDHQSAATGLLQADQAAAQLGVADLLGVRQLASGECPRWPLVSPGMIIKSERGLDLVGSSAALEGADLVLATQPGRERRLAEALHAARPLPYDLVLLDTPPSLGLLTINALVAANLVLTPILAAYLSLRAVQRVQETVQQVRALNPGLQQLGYIFTAVDNREGLVKEARELLRQHLGGELFSSEIRIDSTLKAAPGQKVRRRHAAADYAAAATELLTRLQALQPAL